MLRGEFAAAARRVVLPVLGTLLVHGCAVVTTPGFDYADPKTRTSVTLGQYVPADPDNPPQGVSHAHHARPGAGAVSKPAYPDTARSGQAVRRTQGLHHRPQRRHQHRGVRPPRVAAVGRRRDQPAGRPHGHQQRTGLHRQLHGRGDFSVCGPGEGRRPDRNRSFRTAGAPPGARHQGPAGHGAHPVLPQPPRLCRRRGAHAGHADLHRRADDPARGHQSRRRHHRRPAIGPSSR